MKISAIKSLELRDFRIHQNLLCEVSRPNVVLIGNNGSGKTSVLEAISLLSPGKGMLNSTISELNHNNSNKSIINATLNDNTNIIIENRNDHHSSKHITINGKATIKQTELGNWCDVIWFTADTQYNFLLSSANRRKFFDRMIFAFHPNQATLIVDYEKLIKERLKILQIQGNNDKWLNAVEKQIGTIGTQIAENRFLFVKNCNLEMHNNHLLHIIIKINGAIESMFDSGLNTEEVKEKFIHMLSSNRTKDLDSGRTNIGIHRTDFEIMHENKDITISSSGKQKMFLLSVFEVFARLLSEKKKRTPIILFDEISSFVDHENFDKIIHSFDQNSAQIWMASPRRYDLFDKYDMQIITF